MLPAQGHGAAQSAVGKGQAKGLIRESTDDGFEEDGVVVSVSPLCGFAQAEARRTEKAGIFT